MSKDLNANKANRNNVAGTKFTNQYLFQIFRKSPVHCEQLLHTNSTISQKLRIPLSIRIPISISFLGTGHFFLLNYQVCQTDTRCGWLVFLRRGGVSLVYLLTITGLQPLPNRPTYFIPSQIRVNVWRLFFFLALHKQFECLIRTLIASTPKSWYNFIL